MLGPRRTALLLAVALVAALVGLAASTGTSAQTPNSYTYSGIVTTSRVHSTDNVKVTLVCVFSCTATRPPANEHRPVPYSYQWGDEAGYLGETAVGSDGSWSLTFTDSAAHGSAFLNSTLAVMIWDEGLKLATEYIVTKRAYQEAEDRSHLNMELRGGGRVSGRFNVEGGGALPAGDYVLAANNPADYHRVAPRQDYWPHLFLTSSLILDVDLQTGDFLSPVVPAGQYSLIYDGPNGAYADDILTTFSIRAEQVIVVSQRKTRLTASGTMSGTVADSDGNPIAGARIHFHANKEDTRLNSNLDHRDNAHDGYLRVVTTDANGNYRAEGLLPATDWWHLVIMGESPAGTRWTDIAVGYEIACAIAADQSISCWGGNAFRGQSDVPPGRYTAVTVGNEHVCALTAAGTISCWGRNSYGQTDAPSGEYTAISSGPYHSCALAAAGTISCWGRGDGGALPVAPDGVTFTGVSASPSNCALGSDGVIYCGGNDSDRLIPAGSGYTALAASIASPLEYEASNPFICALDYDQTTTCFGYSTPFICALASDQTIACLGHNHVGETSAPAGRYTAISASTNYRYLASTNFACAIATDQTISCWGDNTYGQLDAPGGQFTAISTGFRQACGITTAQTIKCWGHDAGKTFAGGTIIGNSGDRVRLGAGESVTVNWPRPASTPTPRPAPRPAPAPALPPVQHVPSSPPPATSTPDPAPDPSPTSTTDPTPDPAPDPSPTSTPDPAPDPAPTSTTDPGPGESLTPVTDGSDVAVVIDPAPSPRPAPEPLDEPIPRGNVIERSEVVLRDNLIANQEALLNTYRCLYNIDVDIVLGGCVDGKPARARVIPGEFTAVAYEGDREIRDRLIVTQERLLNAYRCLFDVDTHLVPGGCPKP